MNIKERIVNLRTLAHRIAQPHSDYLATEAARTMRERTGTRA